MKKTTVFVVCLALILTLTPAMALADGEVTVDIFPPTTSTASGRRESRPAGESGSKVKAVVLDDGTRLDRSNSASTILLATNGYVASSIAGIADGEQLGELGGEDSIIRDYLLKLTDGGTKPLDYPITQDRILYANDISPEEYTVSIPVVDLNGNPVSGAIVHAGVDSGAAKKYVTDADGNLNITVPNGLHAIFLDECDIPVYVNNYSGSGTVTTKTGYCEFSFTVDPQHVDPGEGENPDIPPMIFTNVDRDDWFWNAVNWAWENGVMRGKSAETFDPNGLITREEFAAMLFRYEASKNGTPAGRAKLNFPDAGKASVWAVDSLSWCVYATS